MNGHKNSVQHINIEAHNPEFRMDSDAFYHWLVKFWIQCVQSLAAKTFICCGHCYAVSTTNAPFGVPNSGIQTQRFFLSFACFFCFDWFFTRRISWFKLKWLNTTHFKKKTAKQQKICSAALVLTSFHLIAKSLFPMSYVRACCWPRSPLWKCQKSGKSPTSSVIFSQITRKGKT